MRMGRAAYEARKRLDLTQQDIADRVGVVAEVYGRLERGQMLPSVPTLCRLCHALGVDPNTLLGIGEGVEVPRPRLAEDLEITPDIRRLARQWRWLEPSQRAVVRHLIRALLKRNGVLGSGHAEGPSSR